MPAFDLQYVVAGIPVALGLATAFGLAWRLTTPPVVQYANRFVSVVLLGGLASLLLATLMTDVVDRFVRSTALTPLVITVGALFVLGAAAILVVAVQSRGYSSLIVLAWGFLWMVGGGVYFYASHGFVRVPQALGGGAPRCAKLTLPRAGLGVDVQRAFLTCGATTSLIVCAATEAEVFVTS